MTKPVILLAPLLLATTLGAAPAPAAERSIIRPANSVWDDAAALAASRPLSPSAERREAFQNPGVLDPRRLTRGFEEATQPLAEAGQEAGRFLDNGARELAEGTRDFVERGGQNLRNGARSVLEGTSDTLQRLDPTRDAYGDRPRFGADSRQPASRLDPPEPTAADDRRFPTSREAPPFRGRVEPADAQQEFDRQRGFDPTRRAEPDYRATDDYADRYPTDSRGPQFPETDRDSLNRGVNDRGLAERFAGSDTGAARNGFAADDRRRVDPIPRRTAESRRDDRFDAFRDGPSFARETTGRDRSGYPSQDNYDRRTAADDFPSLPDRRSASTWDDNFARGQSPPATGADRYPTQRVDNTGFAGGVGSGVSTAGGDTAVASWNGSGNGSVSGQPANNNGAVNPAVNQAGLVNTGRESAWDMDRFLLVVLTAISCYVVIAHLDLRNRYRAALRGAPAGYGNPLSDI